MTRLLPLITLLPAPAFIALGTGCAMLDSRWENAVRGYLGLDGRLVGRFAGSVAATSSMYSESASVMFCPRRAIAALKRATVASRTYACTSLNPGRFGRCLLAMRSSVYEKLNLVKRDMFDS